jgi:hypothetical protein
MAAVAQAALTAARPVAPAAQTAVAAAENNQQIQQAILWKIVLDNLINHVILAT